MQVVFLAAVNHQTVISGRTRRLAEAMAREHRVYYVNLPSLRHPFDVFKKSYTQEGVTVVSLPPLPCGWALLAGKTSAFWGKLVSRFLRFFIPDLAQSTMIVSSVWWAPALEHLKKKIIIYDCLDHISVMAPKNYGAQAVLLEKKLLAIAQGTCFVTERQALSYQSYPYNKVVIPNGVPSSWIGAPVEPVLLPGRQGAPKIGFIGALYRWIDVGLIAATARLLPDFDFIIVGPTDDNGRVTPLTGIKNIWLLPTVPYQEVPKWMQAFHAAIVPFFQDIISDNADPLKIYEYVACGCPVVSTYRFNAIPMYIATSPETFSQKVTEAVERGRYDALYSRAILKEHTWEARKVELEHFIKRLL